MIDMWFDIMRRLFVKCIFMKIVNGVTFLMSNTSEDQFMFILFY